MRGDVRRVKEAHFVSAEGHSAVRAGAVCVAIPADSDNQVSRGIEHRDAAVIQFRREGASEVIEGETGVVAIATAPGSPGTFAGEAKAAVKPFRPFHPSWGQLVVPNVWLAVRSVFVCERNVCLLASADHPHLLLPHLHQSFSHVIKVTRPIEHTRGGRHDVDVVVIVDTDPVGFGETGYRVLVKHASVLIPHVDFTPPCPSWKDARCVSGAAHDLWLFIDVFPCAQGPAVVIDGYHQVAPG